MTDLLALVQAFLDADDEFVASEDAYRQSAKGGWASIWMRREARDSAKAKRDEAFAAMRAAVRDQK